MRLAPARAGPIAAAAGAGCVARRVGDAHSELGNTDDVVVERCGGRPPMANRSGVAVCVPTTRGPFLESARGARWTEKFLGHYRALGVARFFVYTAAPAAAWKGAADDVDFVELAFLNGCAAGGGGGARRRHPAKCDFAENRSLMYWGQNFALNDCLHRATAANFSFALSLDLDEFLAFAGGTGGLSNATSGPADVVTFGSAVEAPVACGEARRGAACPPPPPPLDAVTCGRGCGDCAACARNRGRRKHVARCGRVVVANVHFVAARGCDPPPCAVDDAATGRAWLRHFSRPSRASPLFEGPADRCPLCAE